MNTEPASLVAKYRIPLAPKAARSLASVLEEHPDHKLNIDGDWLEVHA